MERSRDERSVDFVTSELMRLIQYGEVSFIQSVEFSSERIVLNNEND